jgi:hypothetical protein|tara:strand:- start:1587 stop:2129 length:543 start_codon:yes stop_codon:yes gene_type:complete
MNTEIKIHDGVFDKKWVDDLAFHLSTNVSYIADNIAGRKSWPYGHTGTHRLMGRFFYKYNDWKDVTIYQKECFTDLAKAIEYLNPNLELREIYANIQFMGMNGSFHVDGDKDYKVYILMLTTEDNTTGGEFFVKDGDTVPFKHGRVLEFSGDVVHKAHAFNEPNSPRFSIKFGGYEKSRR